MSKIHPLATKFGRPDGDLLIAETDPRTIDFLPRIVSDQIPNVRVDICTSVNDLTSNVNLSAYDIIAINPILLQAYRLLKFKADRHLLAPLLVTANREEHEMASKYLANEAFGLIVKPIDPKQAAQTIKLALWQQGLLKLLASRERARVKFEEHMNRFPTDLRVEATYTKQLEVLDKTLQAVNKSLQMILNGEEEQSLFDIAASIAHFAKQQALDRLLSMHQNGTSH